MDSFYKIFVHNIPEYFSDKCLTKFFKKFGNVENAFIVYNDKCSKKNNYCGVVTFKQFKTIQIIKTLPPDSKFLFVRPNEYLRVTFINPEYYIIPCSNVKSLKDPSFDEGSSPIKKNNVVCEMNINDLNDECLISIFNFFPIGYSINFERVCRRWKELLQYRWKNLKILPIKDFTFSFDTHPLTTNNLLKLIYRHQNLRVLDISDITSILNYNTINYISKHCPNLEELGLNKIIINKRSAKLFARKIKGLRKLVFKSDIIISDASIKKILKHSPNLEYFELTVNKLKITGSFFNKCNNNLKVIKIVNENEIYPIYLKSFFERAKNLEEIQIDNCRNVEPEYTTEFLNIDTLKILRYRGCDIFYTNIEYYPFSKIGKNKNLVELDLSCNVCINKYIIFDISENALNLEILNLEGCRGKPLIDDDDMILINKMKKLKHLNLNYACCLTDVGLEHISKNENLEKLELVGIAFNKITENGCIKLVENLIKLKILDLCGNVNIRNPFIKMLELVEKKRKIALSINLSGTLVNEEEINKFEKKSYIIDIVMKNTCKEYMRYDYTVNIVTDYVDDEYY